MRDEEPRVHAFHIRDAGDRHGHRELDAQHLEHALDARLARGRKTPRRRAPGTLTMVVAATVANIAQPTPPSARKPRKTP